MQLVTMILLALLVIAIPTVILLWFVFDWIATARVRRVEKQLKQIEAMREAMNAGATYEQLLDMPMPKKLRKQLIAKLGDPR